MKTSAAVIFTLVFLTACYACHEASYLRSARLTALPKPECLQAGLRGFVEILRIETDGKNKITYRKRGDHYPKDLTLYDTSSEYEGEKYPARFVHVFSRHICFNTGDINPQDFADEKEIMMLVEKKVAAACGFDPAIFKDNSFIH